MSGDTIVEPGSLSGHGCERVLRVQDSVLGWYVQGKVQNAKCKVIMASVIRLAFGLPGSQLGLPALTLNSEL
jgi:hypothetical protein